MKDLATMPPPDLLAREQAFFDREAAAISDADLVTSPDQMARYRNARAHPLNSPKDEMFFRLGALAGNNVLDYGCGVGEDTVHFADCGATVRAFDLSGESIAVARRRAELMGFADRCQFDVRAAGSLDYPSQSFDVVAGFAILHHLHTQLPTICDEIDRLLKPGGVAAFIEPVANSRVLRGLRRIIPGPTHATPDERQLTYADFSPMRERFRSVEFHHFYNLERLTRILGSRSMLPLRWVDHHAQRVLPFIKSAYGLCLVIARK
jgi:ubiquinone/menaquinone biosynthesis C-methylase UbiE